MNDAANDAGNDAARDPDAAPPRGSAGAPRGALVGTLTSALRRVLIGPPVGAPATAPAGPPGALANDAPTGPLGDLDAPAAGAPDGSLDGNPTSPPVGLVAGSPAGPLAGSGEVAGGGAADGAGDPARAPAGHPVAEPADRPADDDGGDADDPRGASADPPAAWADDAANAAASGPDAAPTAGATADLAAPVSPQEATAARSSDASSEVPEDAPPHPAPASSADAATGRFDLFVILADMRTGSNFLEANLNAVPGLRCHGEAFNPAFPGEPEREELLGVTLAEREAEPGRLLDALKAQPGLNGFRLFSDHDPRALDLVLADPRVAKVVLTRNPVEAWVSLEMARATDRWRLFNPSHATLAPVRWDPGRFRAHLDQVQGFRHRVLKGLQRTGQAAFVLDYEDLLDLEAVNGLLAWLGAEARLDRLDRRLKKQNPEPLREKVENFADMDRDLGGPGVGGIDRFDLGRTPSFEPRRGHGAGGAMAARAAPLLFLPLAGGPVEAVRDWLAALGGGPGEPGEPGGEDGDAPLGGLAEGFSPHGLRQWKADRPGHIAFTVLRHPLARAHAAFCERVLAPAALPEVRANMRRTFGLPVPEGGVDLADRGSGWDLASHRLAFARFLEVLRFLVAGQSSIRPDPAWASQVALVQGAAGLWPPDLVLREERLGGELRAAAARVGLREGVPALGPTDPHEDRLRAIHGPDLDALARAAVEKDYVAWGFRDWRPLPRRA